MAAKTAKILILDSDVSVVDVLQSLLKLDGWIVRSADNRNAALQALRKETFDVMLANLPSHSDGDLITHLHAVQPHLPVIVLIPYTGINLAMQAVRSGAFDYACKPFKMDELRLMIGRACDYSHAITENASLKERLRSRYSFRNMVGDSDAMAQIYRVIGKVAATDSSVLILGDSGTGKELVAKAIHACSKRADKPFVAINCASLPETLLESELFGYIKGAFTGAHKTKKGLFASADGGTLLLDEVGSVGNGTQMSLLRVLQEHEIRPVGATETVKVDVRVIAATNENLEKRIKSGEFREDLFYRLSVVPIHVPPLRERSADIPPLVQHFVRLFNEREGRAVGVDEKAMVLLRQYAWPGNVRELENTVNRAGALCEDDMITVIELPEHIRRVAGLPEMSESRSPRSDGTILSLKSFARHKEREYIKQILDRFNGNKEEAAEALGISLATLYRKYGDD